MKGLTPFGNRCAKVLSDLGYTYAGIAGNGHFRFTHATAPEFHLSGTAYDGPAWSRFLSEMRRRHPAADHEVLFPKKSERAPQRVTRGRRLEREEAARKARVAAAAAAVRERENLLPSLPEYRGCLDCGHRLLSDRDPMHGCPRCGGTIVSRTAPVADLESRRSSHQPWEPKPARRRAA